MHRPRVPNEIRAGPGEAVEELEREEIALEPIAAAAGGDEVAGVIGAAERERMHVIERGSFEREGHGAVDAALIAVADGGALVGTLGVERQGATTTRMLVASP